VGIDGDGVNRGREGRRLVFSAVWRGQPQFLQPGRLALPLVFSRGNLTCWLTVPCSDVSRARRRLISKWCVIVNVAANVVCDAHVKRIASRLTRRHGQRRIHRILQRGVARYIAP